MDRDMAGESPGQSREYQHQYPWQPLHRHHLNLWKPEHSQNIQNPTVTPKDPQLLQPHCKTRWCRLFPIRCKNSNSQCSWCCKSKFTRISPLQQRYLNTISTSPSGRLKWLPESIDLRWTHFYSTNYHLWQEKPPLTRDAPTLWGIYSPSSWSTYLKI